MQMMVKKCQNCKKEITVREADHKRGWGKFCSKSCKAKKQTQLTGISGPHYKAANMTVSQMQNGKFAKSKFSGSHKSSCKGKLCQYCGSPAVTGYYTNFINDDSPDGIEWVCDQHNHGGWYEDDF